MMVDTQEGIPHPPHDNPPEDNPLNLVFFASFLMLGIAGGLIGTSIPYLIAYFDVPPDQGGLFVTIQTVGGIIANIAIGRLLDRFASRAVVWIASAALALSGGLMMLAASMLGGYLAMLVFGFGFGGMLVAGNTIVTRLNLPHAAPQLNILSVCYGIGATLGPQVTRWILQTAPIPNAYLWIGLAQLILLPFLFAVSVRPAARPVDQGTGAAQPLAWPLLILFAAFLFVYTGAEIGFSAWISTHMIYVAGLPSGDAASYVSLFWFGITAGRVVGSQLARRLSDETILIGAAVLLTGVVGVILLFPQNPAIGAGVTFAFGFVCGPVFPSALALVGRRFPDSIGKIGGGILAAGNIGVALIPWLQGQVSGGVSGGFGVTFACALILIGLAVLIGRSKPAAQSAAHAV
ncbi:MAG: MFS transporter [bacterium]|nr:MFS transporter [bacterium]